MGLRKTIIYTDLEKISMLVLILNPPSSHLKS
jgi:hypothetical protein